MALLLEQVKKLHDADLLSNVQITVGLFLERFCTVVLKCVDCSYYLSIICVIFSIFVLFFQAGLILSALFQCKTSDLQAMATQCQILVYYADSIYENQEYKRAEVLITVEKVYFKQKETF